MPWKQYCRHIGYLGKLLPLPRVGWHASWGTLAKMCLAACAHHCLVNGDKMQQSEVHLPHLGTIVHLLAALFAQGPLFGKQILMFPCSQALYCAIKNCFRLTCQLNLESGADFMTPLLLPGGLQQSGRLQGQWNRKRSFGQNSRP